MLKQIIVCLFLVIAVPVFADNPDSGSESNQNVFDNDNYIGLSASYLSGAGLSIMREWVDGFRTKITGLYFVYKKTEDSRKKESMYKNCGGEVQVDIYDHQFVRYRNSKIRLYLLAGGGYWYAKYHRYKEYDDRYHDHYNRHYSAGGGVGAGLILRDRLGIDIQATYQARNSTINSDRYVGPAAGVSVYFMF